MELRVAFALLALAAIACAGASTPAFVSVPSGPASTTPGEASMRGAQGSSGPESCSQSWRLEDVVEPSVQVLVECAADVRRERVQAGPMARALDPGLAMAHDRVCACAARLAVPVSVGLKVTAVPDDGRAWVETTDPDTSTEGDEAPGFAACVGTFDTTFEKFAPGACEGGGKTKYIYVLDVELSR